MAVNSRTERIGLLFVHGIGEQKRWDHLKASVHELAELLIQGDSDARTTVVDRTDDWKHPAGYPDPDGVAPITLYFTNRLRTTVFECHEVWWADLGARSGLGDVVTFWLWGLGQWSAPIYRELDAAALPKERRGDEHVERPPSDVSPSSAHKARTWPRLAFAGAMISSLVLGRPWSQKPISKEVTLPESVAGNPLTEPLSRLQLVLAALAALFVALSWSIAKRLFSALLGRAPTPTLIVQYVGDVRTYEARAAPGDSALSDPGHPRRVGIRRRMVSEMVAVATSGCDGWYVLAHSLGTVVAYNGLTETGHALPNYLTEEQWARVPGRFKRDPNCKRRDKVSAMMPARPAWLVDEDVIDRKKLFAKLRGFLTYGSPLDKFAALWPRIVATATDRIDGTCPFPNECRWINLAAPSDPVAGALDSYGSAAGDRLKHAIPRVENYRTPWNWKYGLSHIQYFAGAERFAKDRCTTQKREVAKWLAGSGGTIIDHRQSWPVRLLTEKAAYPLLVALLWLFATAFVVALIQGVESLFTQHGLEWETFTHTWCDARSPVLAAALAVILFMGLHRWRREARLNLRLARYDRDVDLAERGMNAADLSERRTYWARIIWMQGAQAFAALILLFVGGALALLGLALDWGWPTNWIAALRGDWDSADLNNVSFGTWPDAVRGWGTVILVSAGLVLSTFVQTILNRLVPPVGEAPG